MVPTLGAKAWQSATSSVRCGAAGGVIEASLAIQKLNTKMSISVKSNRALFDLDLLRAIVVVADCGSFTTAAARLHSTQSTISQKVRRQRNARKPPLGRYAR